MGVSIRCRLCLLELGFARRHIDSHQCSINFSEHRKSALDKNIEAKAILEMAGKSQLSEGICELGENDPMTKEMKPKFL